MNPEIEKKIKAQFDQLPKVIQDMLRASEWKQWVGSIAKKNSLNLDQASSLETETFIFLVGVNSIFDIRQNIQTELNIPASKVNDLMIDINDMIVEPLKQKLIDATSDEEEVPKKEETMDRQKILNAIEEHDHAPGVGVYMPSVKKVQPIAQNAQIKPASIFEAKTNAVIAPAQQKATIIMPERPASNGDLYREPIGK